MGFNEIIAIIVFLAVAGVFLWMITGNVQSFLAHKRSPAESIAARVKEKRSDVGLSEFGSDGVRLGKKVYYATFALKSGEELTFQLLQHEYDELNEDDIGHLSYRDNRYLGFAPDSLIKDGEDL